MTTKLIGNPAGNYGLTADGQTPELVDVVNNSGGTLLPGDLVVIDVTGVLATTTTTASDTTVLGVVVPTDGQATRTVASTETVASGAVMRVCVGGVARINIAANTVAAGAALASSTAAKVAAVPATAGTVAALQALVGSFIAVALESQAAKDANNTIRAFIKKM